MRRWKVIGAAALLCLGLSLIITLFPKGSSRGEKLRFADGEEKLLYMMAAEISPEYEMETLKMQAVIDRTRCRKAQEDQTKEPAQLTPQELAQRWGENYSAYYEKFQKAIIATSGEVITCGGDYIYPEYHYLSDGRTRSMEEVYGRSDFPYLQSVESSQDMEESDYLSVFFCKEKRFSGDMSADLEPSGGDHRKCHTGQCRLCERTDIGRTRDFRGGDAAAAGSAILQFLHQGRRRRIPDRDEGNRTRIRRQHLRGQRDGENGRHLHQYSPVLLYGNRDIR